MKAAGHGHMSNARLKSVSQHGPECSPSCKSPGFAGGWALAWKKNLVSLGGGLAMDLVPGQRAPLLGGPQYQVEVQILLIYFDFD